MALRRVALAGLALLLVTAMPWPIQPATAAPTLVCTYFLSHPDSRDATIGNSATTAAPTFFMEGLQPIDGSLSWSTRILQTGGSASLDTAMYHLTSTCSVAWVKTVTCAATTGGGSSYCLRSGPVADPAGHLTSLLLNGVSPSSVLSENYVHTSINTGNTLNPTVPYNTVPNNPPQGTGTGITGPVNPTGAAAYLFNHLVYTIIADPDTSDGANGALRAYADSTFAWTVAPTGKVPYSVTGSPTLAFVTGWTTAGSDYKKIDVGTHLQSGSNLAGADANRQLVDRAPPRIGQGAQSTKVYGVHGLTDAATLTYDRIVQSTWAKDVTNQAMTGFSANYDARGFDVDANNNLLICGKDKTAGANNLGYVAIGDTTANTFTTLLSIAQPAQFASGTAFQTDACRFDTQGGLWTISSGTCLATTLGSCYSIQRWALGGNFANPAGPATESIYTNPDCFATGCTTATASLTGGVEADQGIKGFGAAVGFSSASGQFLFGYVLAIVAFLIMAGAYASITKHKAGAAWAGIVACAGIMIFNTITGIWSLWVTIVMVVLTSSIVTLLVRFRIFGGTATPELPAGDLQ